MNDVISSLLRALVLEEQSETGDLVIESFKGSLSFLINNKESLFESVVEKSSYDMLSENAVVKSTYFDGKGVLIYDRTDSVTAGKKSYIYRSRGIRMFLMENGTIKIITPHSFINNQNCSFYQEVIDVCDLKSINHIDDIKYVLRYMDDDDELSIVQSTVKLITSIKERFPRGYFIEQFLYPQDMNIQSQLSQNISNHLWIMLLSKSFSARYSDVEVECSIRKLLDIDIKPSFDTLIVFIRDNMNSDIKHIKMVVEHMNRVSLSEIRADVKDMKFKTDPVFEIKPRLFGFAFNVRAFFSWIKNSLT